MSFGCVRNCVEKCAVSLALPNVTEYAAMWLQLGTQMYEKLSKFAFCSVHSEGKQSIAAEIHVKHIQHWHPSFSKIN